MTPSWAAEEEKFTAAAGDEDAGKRPESAAGAVRLWGEDARSSGLLPAEGVFETEDDDVQDTMGGVEVGDPSAEIRGGATPADEDRSLIDEAGVNFGGPDLSCGAPDVSEKQDVIGGGLDP